jgi:hypothetical protein
MNAGRRTQEWLPINRATTSRPIGGTRSDYVWFDCPIRDMLSDYVWVRLP